MFTTISEVLAASTIRAMSRMLVNFYQTTWRYKQEDGHLHIHHNENLKSYLLVSIFVSQWIYWDLKVTPTHVKHE
jgi:hypothetical protein